MIKKAYSKPSLEITEFKAEDIIRTSGGTETTTTVNLTTDYSQWGSANGIQIQITE